MHPVPAPRYVAAGHVCIDELSDRQSRLGGTVFFSSAQAVAMGCDVTVVTSCTAGTAATARAALPAEIELVVQPADQDTRFEFGTDAEEGPQRLLSVATLIDRRSIEGFADILHLAPVFNELTPGLISAGREAARFVGATPQGLLRGTDDDGELVFVADNWPAAVDFADAIVLNDDEFTHLHRIGLLDGFRGWVFRTLGPDGAMLLRDGAEVARQLLEANGPAVAPQRTIGAGDVFAAAAFVALARGDDPAGALATAVRSATGYVRREADRPDFIDGSRA